MSYKLHFLGLIHFKDMKEQGKLVLLPDGRCSPYSLHVSPHYASFFIHPENVDFDGSNWRGETVTLPDPWGKVTEFRVPSSSRITMTGWNQPGVTLDATEHSNLPTLEKGLKLLIVPEWADTIAQMSIRHGTLKSFLLRDPEDPNPVVVSTLNVNPKSEPILILARPDDGSGFKMLKLKKKTEEIVLANTSNLIDPPHDEGSHFRLYGRLDVDRRDNLKFPPISNDLPELYSNHRLVNYLKNQRVPAADCSNSCC